MREAQSVNSTTKDKFENYARTGADLMLTTDNQGVITEAVGDARILRTVDVRMLVLCNVFQMLDATDVGAIRERMSALREGERAMLDDPNYGHEGLRIVLMRDAQSPESVRITLTRLSNHVVLEDNSADDRLLRAFRSALAERALKAALQPVVDTLTGKISHHEVLVRFPFDGSPAPYIAAAEKRGLISQLDCIMLDAAAARLERGDMRLAVNVSGESIQRADIGRELHRILKLHDIDHSRLTLEITESSQIHDFDTTTKVVESLRETGAKIVLDDFGAGAASFGYLRSLNVDGVKFDGCFLSEPGCQHRNWALMSAIARMCDELGMTAVGERVETETDRQTLLRAGVPLAQGYHFGRPVIDESFFDFDAPVSAVA